MAIRELARALIRVSADTSDLFRGFARATGFVRRESNNLSSMVNRAIAGVGGAMLVRHGVMLAGTLEQNKVAFETMLGSASKADDMLRQIADFAASTPFQLPGLQQASKTLLAFRIPQEEIMGNLEMLGNISAGTGKDLNELSLIFGQVKAKGRLMGEEILQLSEAGVPIIAELAAKFGVAESEISDMASKGKISFQDFQAAMQQMVAEGGQFEGLMEKQSKTTLGLFSTLKDNVNGVLTEVFGALDPILKAVLNVALKLTSGVGDAFDAVGGDIISFAKNTADWITAMADNWDITWNLIKSSAILQLLKVGDFFKNMFENWPTIQTAALEAMKAGFIAWFNFQVNNLRRLVEMQQVTAKAMMQGFMDVFTGGGMQRAMDTYMSGMQKIMMDHVQDSGTIGRAAAAAFQREMQDVDLFEASGEQKLMQRQITNLAGRLADAKTQLTRQRQEEERRRLEEDAANQEEEEQEERQTAREQEFGMAGFADLGRSIQDSLLKNEKDEAQQRMVGLLEQNNQLQTQMLEETRQNRPPNPGLA